MPVGLRNPAGVDLENIFAPRVSAAAANVNIRHVGTGVDISQIFEPYNGVRPAQPVNIRAPDGRDLNLIFATTSDIFPSSDINYEDFNPSGSGATASITFNTNGEIVIAGGTSAPASDDWKLPTMAGIGSGYEVMFTAVSGTWTGTLNTWQSLLSARSVSSSRTPNGVSSPRLTAAVRRSGGAQVSTRTVNLTLTNGTA